jgi:hypothetical protein
MWLIKKLKMNILAANLFFIFYFFMVLSIEIKSIYNPQSVIDNINYYKEVIKNKIQEPKISFYVETFYVILTIIGLFSKQWIGFLIIILLGRIPKRNKIWIVIDAILTIIILWFITLNHFHFKLNLPEYILNLFK